ncbi:MAG TPA: sugar ABC transporter ATP-binding protein [Terriglobales bacterium]
MTGAATGPLLAMENISIEFPGVKALDSVSFDLRAHELHAIVGENGAGKSTLMKILAGVYPQGEYRGNIHIDGTVQQFRTIHDAQRAGIAVVFQELSLVPEMTVAENIYLGQQSGGLMRWDETYHRAQALLNRLGFHIAATTRVSQLGIGEQQMIEIAKALSRDARILVLDEPTAALTEHEAECLFRTLQDLRANGVGVIYISHRMQEIFRLSDRVTVLRDGRTVATHPTSELNEQRVVELMVGRKLDTMYLRRKHTPSDRVLEVRNWSVPDPHVRGRMKVRDVNFHVRAGEIVGIAGLMGSGRSELLMSLFGAYASKPLGTATLDGKSIERRTPQETIAAGLAFVTEDRKKYGLVLPQSILRNVSLAALKLIGRGVTTHPEREWSFAEENMSSLRVKAGSPLTVTETLSGGNQQKVVVAKWLLTKPKILLLDEPTRGIDVGAKQEIYELIHRLAAEGLGIVLVSSELPEVLGLSDRVIVMSEGRFCAEFDRDDVTPERVMAAATGAAVHA